jgi:epoxyqueuosine reductase
MTGNDRVMGEKIIAQAKFYGADIKESPSHWLSEIMPNFKGVGTHLSDNKKRGIYLKDAAVLAGFGCIGMNNLMITPQFGPRQRIRVLLVNTVLPSTGSMDFDPCNGCDMP